MGLLPVTAGRAVRTARPAAALLAIAVVVGACGSARVDQLPPAAGPDAAPVPSASPIGSVMPTTPDAAAAATKPLLTADLRDGSLHLSLDPRARTLTLTDALGGKQLDRIPAGVGPTQVACTPQGPCYVTDTTGDALLVIRVAADGRSMRLSRRVYVAGAPYAIAVDSARRRLWVTLTARDELVEFGAHAQPHILRRHPTVQQPDGVRVDAKSGDVTVIGVRPPQLQRLTDPATPDRP
ncbi:MAG: hypothetical protein J7513_17605 [Solirubrobacteraceae bacterium]|nr:hypothetical protein [Solirubrobacteraceae bacterium]